MEVTIGTVLQAAGLAFLRAFGAAILILAPGVLSAPNLNNAFDLGVAALFASLAAGFKAIQIFVPQLSFKNYIKIPYGAWVDSFVQAGLGAFIISITGWLSAPDLSTWKSFVVGALVGAVTAGIRALQGLLTPGESPYKATGFKVQTKALPY